MQFINYIQHYIKNNWTTSFLVIFALANIYLLSPILSEGFLYGDDNTSNFVYTLRISEMISAGNFRFWLGDYSMGQALFFYYQPLAHLSTALIYLTFPFVDPLVLYKLIVLILLILLPWSMYQGMRWIGFTKLMAIIGAVLVYSVSSWRSFGFELGTLFQWGQYSHLWGLVLTPLAIGYAYKNYFGARKLFLPITLLGILFLTHTVMGIIACLAVGSLILVSGWQTRQKYLDVLYLSKIFLGVFCITAMILVPNLLYEDYVDGFSTVDKEKHFGIGLAAAASKFFAGEVFDQYRYPVVTFALLLALVIAGFSYLKNKEKEGEAQEQILLRFLAVNFILSIILISGAETFPFLKYTPVYNSVLVLRLLPLWHFIGILMLAFGLGKLIVYARNNFSTSTLEVQFVKYLTQLGIVVLIFYLGYRQQNLFYQKAKTYHLIGDNADQSEGYSEALSFLGKQKNARLHLSGYRSHFELHLPPILADKPITKFFAASSHTNLGLFYLKHMKDTVASHYDLFGVPYLLHKKKSTGKTLGELIFENEQYEVFKTPAKAQYFDITHANTVCFSHNQAARTLLLNWMHTPELIQHKEYLVLAEDRSRAYFEEKGFVKFIDLEQSNKRVAANSFSLENLSTQEKIKSTIGEGIGKYLSQGLDAASSTSYGEVIEEQVEDGYYKAKLQIPSTKQDSLLWATLKVNAHPDWIAKVDGVPVEWVQMSPCFMAVPVKAGTHIVEFEFAISPLRKALMGLSFLTIIGLGIFEFLQTKRSKQFQILSST